MNHSHRELLDRAVAASEPLAGPLRGAAIFVTGASGFLAASLLVFLHELDRAAGLGLRLAASARRPASEVALFRFLDLCPAVEWSVAAAEESVVPAGGDFIVVHTASYGSPRDYLREPLATFRANTAGLERVFTQGAARHLVYFSSAEIYGQPPGTAIPTREDFIGGLDTLSVRSIYGESKRMAEVLGTCLSAQTGIPFTALRPWNVYGPGQRLNDGRVPMEFIRQARAEGRIALASNGRPRRAFCFVWDAIRQIVAALAPAPEEAAAYNIGNGSEEITILELARRCAEACGLPASVVTFDPGAASVGLQRCAPEVRAIQARLPEGAPLTPLDTGLRTLVEWSDFLR